MPFSAADQAAMIAATGQSVTIDDTPVTAKFRLASEPVVLFDGSVMSSAPTVMLTAADYAATAPDVGSIVQIDSTYYQVTEPPSQDSGGFWRLILTKDAAIPGPEAPPAQAEGISSYIMIDSVTGLRYQMTLEDGEWTQTELP